MQIKKQLLNLCVLAVTAAVFTLAGCESRSPVSSNSEQSETVKEVVQSNIGPVRLLQVEEKELTLMKGKTFSKTKKIKAKHGGTIEVGDRHYGKSKITFKKNDLPEDLTISFEWVSGGTFEGMLNDLEFGPHGLVFNSPVEVRLSYKKADLQGFNEKDLKLFYYNEETELWEFIGGEVDEKKKIVIGFLDHFSRYAIGAE